MAKEILLSYRATPGMPIAIRYGDYLFEVRHRVDKGPRVWELQRYIVGQKVRKSLFIFKTDTAIEAAIEGLKFVKEYGPGRVRLEGLGGKGD